MHSKSSLLHSKYRSVRNEASTNLRRINSVACGNNRKPQRNAVCYTFGFKTRCQKKVIKFKPYPSTQCFLARRNSIFCKTSLFRKVIRRPVSVNPIHKIQTSIGVCKSWTYLSIIVFRSICLMRINFYKIIQIIFFLSF